MVVQNHLHDIRCIQRYDLQLSFEMLFDTMNI